MDSNWFIRLKNARVAAGFSLKEVSGKNGFGISQQSIIKYEKGEIFPKIDILDRMCESYHVTVDFIMYGPSNITKINEAHGHLVSLFFLLISQKLKFSEKSKTLTVQDELLSTHIMALNAFAETKELSTMEDLTQLVKAIKTMSEE